MTYKDLMIYILTHNLENEEVFKDGKLAGFMSVEEFAASINVGVSTVEAYIEMNMIKYIKIGECYFIPKK